MLHLTWIDTIAGAMFGKIPDEEEVVEEEETADADEADDTDEADAEEEVVEEEPEEEEVPEPEQASERTYPEPDVKRLLADNKKLRDENKKRRLAKAGLQKEYNAYKTQTEEEKTKAKRAKMEETERLKDEKSELEQKLQASEAAVQQRSELLVFATRSNAVINEAAVMGFSDPNDAVLLLGGDFDTFEINEDGDVDSNQVRDKLSALLEGKPYLLKGQEAQDTPVVKESQKPTNQPSKTKVKKQKVGQKADDEEGTLRNELKAEIRQPVGEKTVGKWLKLNNIVRRKHTGPDAFQIRDI
jgi:hypothetical protein